MLRLLEGIFYHGLFAFHSGRTTAGPGRMMGSGITGMTFAASHGQFLARFLQHESRGGGGGGGGGKESEKTTWATTH